MTAPVQRTAGPTTPVEVGPLRLWSPVILAPMAGVTDAPFRRLCRYFGEKGLPKGWFDRHRLQAGIDAPAGLYVMEMVTSRALVEGVPRTMDMVRPDPRERVRSVQLYGVIPKVMGQATKILIHCDLADHIDLNFGCPVPKVTRKGGGAAIPWKRDLFADIIAEVVGAADAAGKTVGRNIPVTIKMRIGIDDTHETYLDAARIAQNLGVAAIGLHARTQTQHYSGKARWDDIRRLKDTVTVPVLGNGDIFAAADAVRMMETTGCDAVVVGRGCQGRPWLFTDLVAATHGQDLMPGPSLRDIVDIIEQHARWAIDDAGDEYRAMREMRKHVGWYLRGFAVGGAARHALNRVSTLDELVDGLHSLNLDQPFPPAAEGPRGRAGGEKTPHLPNGWLDHPYLTRAERANLHLAEEVGGSDGG
ncbi:tRNA dihydrouridine synthase DusB [Schaalia suimastitidis]|uniref:tRNA dihydrouridine synthase DusB n=1 Tax=Schaalia suimastitidis TaxID=121163 RepID=UPI00040DDAE3|nr:tRNA dihydrouridine synthase DusB [Schaalia suimastitidis]